MREKSILLGWVGRMRRLIGVDWFVYDACICVLLLSYAFIEALLLYVTWVEVCFIFALDLVVLVFLSFGLFHVSLLFLCWFM